MFLKLGHSSILLKVYGEYWLIDPVFSDRASPFQFVGPKRFHQPPISLEDLPPIDKVLISHNHYDHLDKASIKILLAKTQQFLVPKGVDGDLINWGVEANKIVTFDWWQELQTNQGLVAFTPTQHFSGRGMGDGNTTLWGSWVIKTPQESVFFSGDSGYFSGFKEIGDKYGPFDLTMVETGAYDKDWADIHMKPEESIQAHMDLQGKVMMPIHNGTFDLAFHTWHDPFDRVVTEAERREVTLSTPEFGRIFSIIDLPPLTPWWQQAP
ncbi:MBL fold metallo-hydrolase [Marinomonas foliarum]|uniref:L-ascorbate metabolism protein UlaG (Beta-lactamase superfamily) n=1 Tax=Marinomonas foliarum TaxID=491950 RepID=A0A368ZVD0_9GAMM|nr:MBL fold metallo-hydrolase [Marinomonas foliarum]RCX00925.1 L-ascorbate metabolism protein UlaG (beta-lactamase superfamily) [Marinomonas foliarum]